jgi:hypothetical protein
MTDPNPLPLFGNPVGPWHDHFAWWPLHTYDDRFVWLRWVRRRRIQLHHYLPGAGGAWWQHHCEAQ